MSRMIGQGWARRSNRAEVRAVAAKIKGEKAKSRKDMDARKPKTLNIHVYTSEPTVQRKKQIQQ